MRRRLALAAAGALAAAAAALVPSLPTQAAAHEQFRPVTIARHGSVLVRSLDLHAPPGAGTARKPVMRLNGVVRPGPASSAATLLAATAATGPNEEILSRFAGASLDGQLPLGADQFVTPPDPQIAAGPTQLVEMVNSSGSVWDKHGNRLKNFDLNTFFRVPSGYTFSDPRVLFDQDSQRWFASGVAFIPPTFGSVIVIAVSTTADALGTWTQYTADNSSNLTHDQPKIGVSSDKFVISWNDFLQASFFQGQSLWVLQKSEMVSGSGTVHGSILGPDSSRSSLVPAVQITSSSDAYVVYNASDCATLGGSCARLAIGVIRLSGTPLVGGVTLSESDPGIAATSGPPTADQPGMPASIATNDDRFLTAVWDNGVLWTGGNDACRPANDTATRPCSRLIQVLTAGATVNQSFDIASTGGGLYYPALAMDGSGDMYVAYNISSSTQYIGVRITGQLASAPVQTIAGGQTIRTGDATYNMNPCFLTNMTSRWGDYNGAAIDPQNPTDVWVSGEYAAIGSAANNDAGCDWATYAARLTFSAPAVSGISPASGSSGTAVTVTGTDFTPAATVSFGSAAATAVSVQSPDQLTATAPSGSGTVDVTVTTADGTSATSAADRFTFSGGCGACATVTAVSPASGPAAGGNTVNVIGTGFVSGATTINFGTTVFSNPTCTSTDCTVTAPPGAGTVTVTANVSGQPAAGSASYTYIASLTSISTNNGPAVGGTLVTFTGAGFDTGPGKTAFFFGGNPATGVSCSSSTHCTGTSPAGQGAVTVTVSADGLAGTGSAGFTYVPSLSSISPSSGPLRGGTVVTITGTGLAAGQVTFRFGGMLATNVSCNSAGTSCTATTPMGFGTESVTAAVNGFTSNSLTFTYRRRGG